MKSLKMVDLTNQYLRLKSEIDDAVTSVMLSSEFIQGGAVRNFERQLENFTGSRNVVTCGNGTDALLAAFMSLGIGAGDEVIMPTFTFVAAAETVALLGAKPVFVDVLPDSFNIDTSKIELVITSRTKAVVPVHLFGQCADMSKVMEIAERYNLKVVEDACQAIGAVYTFPDGTQKQAGTIGDVGCLSFFPSKNLGCFGDGGALLLNDDELAAKVRMICKHGSTQRYRYEIVGLNSRLDSIQAAILGVKLRRLDEFIRSRQAAADFYFEHLSNLNFLSLPAKSEFSSHTFHQFTVRISNGKRNFCKEKLSQNEIPSMIYYPQPLHLQPAYSTFGYKKGDFPVAEQLCDEVLSLPMHTELTDEQLQYICNNIVNLAL